ncbi:MAG: HEAT repeat domain-containing protein [Anaerolineae bacterium]
MDYERTLLHISNSSERLNVRYLYALSEMTHEKLGRFREVWPNIEVGRRRLLIRNLVELTEHSFEVNFDPIFLVAMGDEDSEVRVAAVDGLWENEDPALIGPLVHLLRADEAASVRAAAATALARFVLLGELEKIDRAPAMLAEQALLETLRHGEEELEVRRRAVEAIAYSGEAGVREIIEAAYYDDDEKMQASALFAMGRSADPYWGKLLVQELDNPNPELRFEAARACGELETRLAVSRLISMSTDDPDREVQQAAVWALGRIGGREARQALEACYESDDEVLSQAAAEALDEMDMLGEDLSIILFDDYDEYE